jgi:hypothetical protein
MNLRNYISHIVFESTPTLKRPVPKLIEAGQDACRWAFLAVIDVKQADRPDYFHK